MYITARLAAPGGPERAVYCSVPSPRELPAYVRGWGRWGIWIFPFIFLSFFTGHIPSGQAGTAGRLPCLGLFEEGRRVCPGVAGEARAGGDADRDAPQLGHPLASCFFHRHKKRIKTRSPRVCPAGIKALTKAPFAQQAMGGWGGRGRNARGQRGTGVGFQVHGKKKKSPILSRGLRAANPLFILRLAQPPTLS